MLVRLELLKMARESLPGADIDDILSAAEKMAAFVEEQDKPPPPVARVDSSNVQKVHIAPEPPKAEPPKPEKKHRSSLSRFPNHELKDPADMRRVRSNAAVEGRTVYPNTVVDPKDSPALLVSGKNNRKLGDRIEKGPWKGLPIYHLTLEERATCPSDCHLWDACFGNAMGQARRHSTKDLELYLEREIEAKCLEHPDGFAVRLHTLGDFFSVDYVRFWRRMILTHKVFAFGFTKHRRDSEIGKAIKALTDSSWEMFAIRFSDPEPKAQGATVIDYLPETPQVDEGTVCPAETGRTQCCGTCGLCWSPTNKMDTIVFVKHGVVIEGEAETVAEKTRPEKSARHETKASETKPGGLTTRQRDLYLAIEKRNETREGFRYVDLGNDLGIGKEAVATTARALMRKGFLSVKLRGPNPAEFALLKSIDGTVLGKPKTAPTVLGRPLPPKLPSSNPAEEVKRPPRGKAEPKPKPAPRPAPKPPVVSQHNAGLVRPQPRVSLNSPAPSKQEPPAYDESMVRRFEGKSRDVMVREALEGQGYEVKSAGSDNWGKSGFLIDGKKVDATKAIEMADEIRAAKGLEPIGKAGAA